MVSNDSSSHYLSWNVLHVSYNTVVMACTFSKKDVSAKTVASRCLLSIGVYTCVCYRTQIHVQLIGD